MDANDRPANDMREPDEALRDDGDDAGSAPSLSRAFATPTRAGHADARLLQLHAVRRRAP